MQSVRPDNSDPIPLRRSQQSMGSIMIRFVGLLLVCGRGSGADLEPLNFWRWSIARFSFHG